MENGTTLTFSGGQPGGTMIRKYLQKRKSSMSRLHEDKRKKYMWCHNLSSDMFYGNKFDLMK